MFPCKYFNIARKLKQIAETCRWSNKTNRFKWPHGVHSATANNLEIWHLLLNVFGKVIDIFCRFFIYIYNSLSWLLISVEKIFHRDGQHEWFVFRFMVRLWINEFLSVRICVSCFAFVFVFFSMFIRSRLMTEHLTVIFSLCVEFQSSVLYSPIMSKHFCFILFFWLAGFLFRLSVGFFCT